MLSRLRRLERLLAKQLAQLIAEEHTEELIATWQDASDQANPLPEPLDFVRAIGKAGYFMRRGAAVTNYLSDCWRKRIVPNESRLYQMMLPWRYPRFPKLPGRA